MEENNQYALIPESGADWKKHAHCFFKILRIVWLRGLVSKEWLGSWVVVGCRHPLCRASILSTLGSNHGWQRRSWVDPLVCRWKDQHGMNCQDRHRQSAVYEKTYLIWEGENGICQQFTYREFDKEVCKFASALKQLEYGKGDVVGLYLPRIPETLMAYFTIIKCHTCDYRCLTS